MWSEKYSDMFFDTGNPYRGKISDDKYFKWKEKYEGVYDGEAHNYLLKDKLEMKVVRNHLWTHGKYTLESVRIRTVIIHNF